MIKVIQRLGGFDVVRADTGEVLRHVPGYGLRAERSAKRSRSYYARNMKVAREG
jgi:hypothetical protein